MKICVIGTDTQTFLKRAFWLLWLACEGTHGEGRRRDDPLADEDSVWQNVVTQGDYPGSYNRSSDHELEADYVFGRRIKWGCVFKGKTIRFFTPEPFSHDEHDFWRDFETNRDVADAVCTQLGCRYRVLDKRGIWDMADNQCCRELDSFGIWGPIPKSRRRRKRSCHKKDQN